VKDAVQNVRSNLATTSGTVAELGQFDRQSVFLLSVEQLGYRQDTQQSTMQLTLRPPNA